MAESWYLGLSNPSNWGCWVHQDINGHHDHLVDGTMLLLIAHCSGSACQTLIVSAHKSLVYGRLNNLFWDFFEEALARFLHILKSFLLNLTIMVFTPLILLGTRFFGGNGSEIGWVKGAQKWCFCLIPTGFRPRQNFEQFFSKVRVDKWLNLGT